MNDSLKAIYDNISEIICRNNLRFDEIAKEENKTWECCDRKLQKIKQIMKT